MLRRNFLKTALALVGAGAVKAVPAVAEPMAAVAEPMAADMPLMASAGTGTGAGGNLIFYRDAAGKLMFGEPNKLYYISEPTAPGNCRSPRTAVDRTRSSRCRSRQGPA